MEGVKTGGAAAATETERGMSTSHVSALERKVDLLYRGMKDAGLLTVLGLDTQNFSTIVAPLLNKEAATQVDLDKIIEDEAKQVFKAALDRFKETGELDDYDQSAVSISKGKVTALLTIFHSEETIAMQKLLIEIKREFYSAGEILLFLHKLHTELSKKKDYEKDNFPNLFEILEMLPK